MTYLQYDLVTGLILATCSKQVPNDKLPVGRGQIVYNGIEDVSRLRYNILTSLVEVYTTPELAQDLSQLQNLMTDPAPKKDKDK